MHRSLFYTDKCAGSVLNEDIILQSLQLFGSTKYSIQLASPQRYHFILAWENSLTVQADTPDVQQRLIWCEPRGIITINKVVTGRFAPGKTDNITNGYAKIQKIIQKDCRNAENPHCIFRIFAVTTRAPAGDSNPSVLPLLYTRTGNNSRPCGGQQPIVSTTLKKKSE